METQLKAKIVLLSTFIFVVAFIITFINLNTYEDIKPIDNPQLDIYLKNIARPRVPTQFDVYLGDIKYQNNILKLYKSKTIKTFDYGKVFIGGIN